jgi:hypothetical protein
MSPAEYKMQPTIHWERKAGYGRGKYLPNVLWVAFSIPPGSLLSAVSFLNIRIVVNSVINLVNKNLPRTALQICMFHFNYNFTIIVPNAFNYLKNVATWEQCSIEL